MKVLCHKIELRREKTDSSAAEFNVTISLPEVEVLELARNGRLVVKVEDPDALGLKVEEDEKPAAEKPAPKAVPGEELVAEGESEEPHRSHRRR